MLSKLQHTSRVSKDVFIKSILNTYLLSIFIYYQHYRNNIYVYILYEEEEKNIVIKDMLPLSILQEGEL